MVGNGVRTCNLTIFLYQAEDGIRVRLVTGVQTCALPICRAWEVKLKARQKEQWDLYNRWIIDYKLRM